MTRVSEMAEHWFGLCRKAPVLPVAQAGIGFLPASVCEGQPDGRAGGSGAIRRGIGSAISGMRILNRNRQLLGFTLLIGLVMAGTIVIQGALSYLNWILSYETGLRYFLSFIIEFATLFCLVILLAGLVMSIAQKREGAASFAEGLYGVKKFIPVILLWSGILALAGMLLSRVFFYPGGLFSSFGPVVISMLTQYPFPLDLNPSTFAEVPGYGGRSFLFWTYPYGLENALEFLVINLLLVIATLYVVPLVVLEQKSLREAVVGSFALMKRTWIEIITCTVLFSIIVYGVFLTYLLVQAAHGMATPPQLLYDRPTVLWLASGVIYYLILTATALVVATVGGIASLELFRHAALQEAAE